MSRVMDVGEDGRLTLEEDGPSFDLSREVLEARQRASLQEFTRLLGQYEIAGHVQHREHVREYGAFGEVLPARPVGPITHVFTLAHTEDKESLVIIKLLEWPL